MAVTITKDNKVSMTRGDSWEVPLFLNKGTAMKPLRYYLQDEDKVYLAIMEPNQPFEQAIVKKVFTNKNINRNGDVVVRIEPEDTACLKPGKYFYQIKAKFIKNVHTLEQPLVVEKTSTLLQGSELLLGSRICGTDVATLAKGNTYYITKKDLFLEVHDVLSVGSKIVAGSILNDEVIQTDFDVNTVVQKTEFIIQE